MPKINNFDSNDNLTISDLTTVLDAATGLNITTGVVRNVQDWQLEKHIAMIEADMTAAQKTKAQSIIEKVKLKNAKN